MRRLSFWALALVLLGLLINSLAVTVLAETPAAQSNAIEAHATAKLIADTDAIVAGKPFRIGVELNMDPGWHTYYRESGDAGMPTRIKWKLPEGFKVGDLQWQRPNKFNDAGIITYGYSDRTLIGATITPPAQLSAKGVTIGATVKWLTCKEMCLPGGTEVSLKLPAAASATACNVEAFATLGFNGPVNSLTEHGAVRPASDITVEKKSILDQDIKVEGTDSQQSLLAYLGLAFIGGFILNFMPCVLPVISIKVLSFMQQAGDDPKRVFQLGMTFTAGIVTSFMALAGLVIGIQAAGQKIGWGFQFQFPVFLLAMASIVLLFALSLFGLFYIQLNAGQQQIDKLAHKEGFVGTFFKGVLATTLSTPCTAPFLGTALGFAFSQPAWVIALIFFVIALGMASPYMVLTARPGWMKYMPKPGVWMEKFKEAMGFLLLATVVWLIWVLGQQAGVNAAMAATAFLLTLSFAVWVCGKFTDLTSTNVKKTAVYSGAAVIIAAGFAIFLAPNPVLLSTSVPAADTANNPVQLAVNTATQSEGLDWVPFSVAALDQVLSENKTVFIDFTADWCLTCKVNESTVINTAPVIAKLKEMNVVTMRADWTKQDPEISRILQKFGRSGVPLYVIFPAGKPNEAIVLPEVITQQTVLDRLARAAKM